MQKTLFSLALLSILGCGEEDAPSPKDVIAPNTATVIVDGVSLPIDVNQCTAEVTPTGLVVKLRGSQATSAEVVLYLAEFQKKPEKFLFMQPTLSNISLQERTSGSTEHSASMCNPYNREVEIVEYNEMQHTVSGRFTAKLCSSYGGATSKVINSAEFNLPYR